MTTNHHGKKTLILGSGEFVWDLLCEIAVRPQCGYRVIGIVAGQEADNEADYGYPLLGSIENLHRIIQKDKPEVIIVAFPYNSPGRSDHQLLEARCCKNITIEQGEAVYERLAGKLPIETLAPRGVIYSNDFQPSRLSLLATRILSLCFSIIGLIIFFPLLLLIAVIIKLDSRGPVLFIQQRIGSGGKSFKLLKFRTMHPSNKHESEWEGDNIHRITRVGRWLRKFRLDELPQFFNVLTGDMNIVGPRPHPASNFQLFVLVARNTPECGIQIPYYSMRSSVRPGITGWAQVRYRYANNIIEEMEKLRFDLYYLKHYSFWLDIRILFETIKVIFSGHVADSATSAGTAAQPDTTLPDSMARRAPAS